ncbi:MAG: nicotinamide riboside transporter PnuC, partial [Saprospiraceae bacterium]|nr:nicotinamide riboside transporter PnuC [Saprospiraceae bacterium]
MDITLFTLLEAVAVVSGIVHVYLLTRRKIIAWPFGIISVGLYAYIFSVSLLYSDVILHVVYLGLNIYGWVNWSSRSRDDDQVHPTVLPWSARVAVVLLIVLGSLAWGYVMARHTNADFPYGDAFT